MEMRFNVAACFDGCKTRWLSLWQFFTFAVKSVGAPFA
jgi:hypothetical protein